MSRSNSLASLTRIVVPSRISAPATAIVAVATNLPASSRLHFPGWATVRDDPHYYDD